MDSDQSPVTLYRVLKFAVPSLLGAFFFLFPVWHEGTYTIPIAVLTDLANDFLGKDVTVMIAMLIVATSALLSVFFSWIARPADTTGIRGIFAVNSGWVVLRMLGLVTACLGSLLH